MKLPSVPSWQTAWKILCLALLVLILGRFILVGLPKVLLNTVSSDGDESAYLALGLALRESGTLSDGTRPFFYPLLLSPFAEREWAYFTTAKLLTLGMGALTIVAVFAAGARLFSWEAALLAAFFLAANKEFHVRASTVYADTLLAPIMLGSWYFLSKSLQNWKYGIPAGIFVGLSFLTKGSAPVLLAAWGLTALVIFRWRLFRRVELLVVPLCFILTSLPLLLYNAREFGSPTYNFATQHIMWMDRLEQINTADPAELPTFASYIASHSPADGLARLEKGLRRLNPVVAETLIPSRAFEPAWLGPVLGLLAVVSLGYLVLFQRAALGRYLARYGGLLWFTFFLNGLFYIFFTWYVAGSSAETRFIVPLLAPLYLVAADGVVSLVRGLKNKLPELSFLPAPISQGIWSRLVLLLLVAWAAWWLVETSRREAWTLAVDPYAVDRDANAEVDQVVGWLAADQPGTTSITFGPSKSLPLWKFPARFTVERLPSDAETWPAMQAHLQAAAPGYIIIDADTARRRRQVLGDYFQQEDDMVRLKEVPPGWALAFVYPGLPCRWCIFTPVGGTVPLAIFNEGIELLDFRATPVSTGPAMAQAGETGDTGLGSLPQTLAINSNQRSLRASLAWRASQALPADYTIFVHLTAPDGFVKAQQDRPPFGGALPTSRWQPNSVLADRYDLALDASITPGEYLLLAGLYNPATGERLPLNSGPAGPAENTLLLAKIRVE